MISYADMDQFRSSRVTVIAGAYGSGKTELSVNFSVRLAGAGKNVTLVDIDILKPMFRSRELKDELEPRGVRVVSSMGGYEMADLPAMSPEVFGALDGAGEVVIDVGGDDGARALGWLNKHFQRSGYEMLYIVNTFRPFSGSAEEIAAMLRRVEEASRLRCSALVSNANLGAESTYDDTARGLDIVRDAALEVGIPVKFVAVSRRVAQARPDELEKLSNGSGLPIFVMDRHMLCPWEDRVQA